jgi:hypothetical protein
MLLGVAYLFAAALLTNLLNDDGPGWLNLLVILGIWNGFKFIAFGPISLILLARASIIEQRLLVQPIAEEEGVSNLHVGKATHKSPDREKTNEMTGQ